MVTQFSCDYFLQTLRKGATEQEKAEFLKEAQLMSNFKHEHILQLLGVCLDNDPNFIIMELMENGDLLSYLRSNRPLLVSNLSQKHSNLDCIALFINWCMNFEFTQFLNSSHTVIIAPYLVSPMWNVTAACICISGSVLIVIYSPLLAFHLLCTPGCRQGVRGGRVVWLPHTVES